MKVCSKCGKELSLDNFCKKKSSKDGLAGHCRSCASKYSKVWHKANLEKQHAANTAYRKANLDKGRAASKKWSESNPEKRKAAASAWYLANKEESKACHKRWSEANPEKASSASKRWGKINPEKANAASKKWSNANPEKRKAVASAWSDANPEKRRQYKHRRRAAKRSLLSTLTVAQWEDIKQHFDNACCYCGKKELLHQEHFLALSKGGEYSHDNILPACRSCNSSKGSKNFLDWYPRYRHYSKKREKAILDFLNYKNNTQQLSISL